jgi:hypothetical protein
LNHWNTRFQAEDYVYGKKPNIFLEENYITEVYSQKQIPYNSGGPRDINFLFIFGISEVLE